MDQTPPNMDAVFSAIRSLLIVVGTSLLGIGFTEKSPLYFWITAIAGAITVVGPAAWGVYVSLKRAWDARAKTAHDVQAGMNIVVQGQALTQDGKIVSAGTGDGSTPVLLPVTEASAAAISKTFGPVEKAKAA